MDKSVARTFWAHFPGHPYRSNGTKIHLDVSKTSGCFIKS